MRLLLLPLLVSTALAAACGRRDSDRVPVTPVGADDPTMNAAIEKARASVNTFITALRSPKPSQAGFAIKKMFSDGKNAEHMWLAPVTYGGKRFQGTVNNIPANLAGVKMGQRVAVETHEITDWMYLENKKLVGGYTIRVLHERMSAEEKAEFKRHADFILD